MAVCFLLGTGRNGSTFFYKMLSLHPRVGYISNYVHNLPGWLPAGYLQSLFNESIALKKWAWFEKTGNAWGVDRNFLKKLVPMPREGENIYRRSGLPRRPAKDYALDLTTAKKLVREFDRLRRHTRSQIVVSKRTANMHRIQLLNEVFPKAKFINLVRDGRAVTYSLSRVRWWTEKSILPESGQTFSQLIEEGEHPLAIAAQWWAEAAEKIRKDLELIPKGRQMDLRYEDLLAEPEREWKRILDFLELQDEKGFLHTVLQIEILKNREAWKTEWTQVERNIVERKQRDMLLDLGYI